MKKQEYINKLNELLACLPADHRLESVSFYEEMIDDRMEDGMTEEQAVAALDAPGVAAEKILDELPAVPRVVMKTRRKSRVLLWSAVIIGSPLWAALALAFAMTVLGIYACIWLLAVCIWLIAVMGILCLPLGILLAFWGIGAGNGAFALSSVGAGLVGAALGTLCARGAFAASKQLALLSRKWIQKALSLFVNKYKNSKGGSSSGGTDGTDGANSMGSADVDGTGANGIDMRGADTDRADAGSSDMNRADANGARRAGEEAAFAVAPRNA